MPRKPRRFSVMAWLAACLCAGAGPVGAAGWGAYLAAHEPVIESLGVTEQQRPLLARTLVWLSQGPGDIQGTAEEQAGAIRESLAAYARQAIADSDRLLAESDHPAAALALEMHRRRLEELGILAESVTGLPKFELAFAALAVSTRQSELGPGRGAADLPAAAQAREWLQEAPDSGVVGLPSSEARPTRALETSITLDYRKEAWGLERMALDGVSNHLPHDSGGSAVSVRLLQDGRWVDLAQADPARPTDEVVFSDDGKGYDAGRLAVLHSPKAGDPLSVGQFGEGLKLVAAAALREGVSLEYRSRAWSAVPHPVPESIDGQPLEKLGFKIAEGLPPISGSRTIFRRPPAGLLAQIFDLRRGVLALNTGYRVLHQAPPGGGYPSRIVAGGGTAGSLYVKGVRIAGMTPIAGPMVFGYDLGIEKISPNRQSADLDAVRREVRALLQGSSNREVLIPILIRALKEPKENLLEFRALKPDEEPPYYVSEYQGPTASAPPWIAAFRAAFGEKAVLASSDVNVNTDAKLMGHEPVALNEGVASFLRGLGAPSADRLLSAQSRIVYVEPGELTAAERRMLELKDRIDEILTGGRLGVPVKVYAGLFASTGREIESARGIHLGGRRVGWIGLKRARLADRTDFIESYVHELGHWITGKGDYDREFVAFFTQALAKLAGERLDGGPSTPPGIH